MPRNVKQLEELERALLEQLGPDSDDYEEVTSQLSDINTALSAHYNGLRKVDDAGKVIEETPTRLPSSVGDKPKEAGYFFEPNVREVQSYLRKNPEALDRLQSAGVPLRNWAEGVATDAISTPMYDTNSGGVIGYNTIPAKTHLDRLSEEEEPYGVVANDMWRSAMEQAQKKGGSLKRYRDIKVDTEHLGNWIRNGGVSDLARGGAQKVLSRIVAPGALGAADSMSAGQASPAYDTARDLADYRMTRMSPEERETASAFGYSPDTIEDLPSSGEIVDRSLPAYMVGNIVGSGAGSNPTNMIQNATANALGYGERGVLGRMGSAAVAGAVSNAEESVVGDMARYANEGQSIPVGNIALNALGAGALGLAGGGVFDLAGQGVGKARDTFRGYARNAPLRTLEEGGGSADAVWGVTPPDEVKKAYSKAAKDRLDATKAPMTGAGILAAELAPELDKSVRSRAAATQERLGKQTEAYYNHPAYRDIKVSAKPAVDGLLELARRGWTRGRVDNAPKNMYPERIESIGGVIRGVSQLHPVANADAPSIAYEMGGVAIDGALANHLFGLEGSDAIGVVRPGQMGVIVPDELTAENLTTLEDLIDDELNMGSRQGRKDDPVYNRFNERVKAMRDDFPLYEDETGKLVSPPPESVRREPYSMDPEAVPQQDEMRVLNPPEDIHGGPQIKPEGLEGIGPEHRPPIPENLFDPRLPISREYINPQPTIDVRGDVSEPGYIGPEAIPGVGPNYQPPDDPRRLGPPVPVQGQFDMGGEYDAPPMVEPGMRGIGQFQDPRALEARGTAHNQPTAESLSPQPTRSVQGSYNRPPEVQMEPAPATNRNPYGFADRGQPPPEQPLPPSERNPFQAGPEESLSLLAGNDLAMKVPEEPRVPTERAPQALPAEETPELLGAFPPKKRIQLAEVRAKLGDMPRAEQDKLLLQMQQDGELVLYRNDNPRSITEADKQAAMDIAGSPRHLVYFTPNEEPQTSAERAPRAEQQPSPKTEAPGGKTFGIVDKQYGSLREKTFTSLAEAKKEAARLGSKYKSQGRFTIKKVDAPAAPAPEGRGGLEEMLDAQLDRPDAPRVPNTEIEEIGALQTADREQVAHDQRAYVDELFSPGKEARATEVAKVKDLVKDQQVIEEAMAQINDAEKRLGPMEDADRRKSLASIISKKLGREVTVEDLIRLSVLSGGLLQMATSDDEEGGELGAAVFGLGMFGRGKGGKPAEPEAPAKPRKPTEPTATLDNGREVKGFSALRSKQHGELKEIEQAMKRLGVEGDTTMEGRIRTYGQLDDRGKVDQALLDEATAAGKAPKLRQAAAANAYGELRDRSSPFGSMKGLGNALIDMLGFRLYKGAEYLSGRFSREQVRNPYVKEPTTALGKMQQTLLEDPARRLFDFTRGGPASRQGAEELWELLKDESVYKSVEDEEKKKRKQPSP